MTELQKCSCELVVEKAILKGIGINVNVNGHDDGRIRIDVGGVPYEYRDRITEGDHRDDRQCSRSVIW